MVLADGRLGERGRQRDRRDDRAGGGVGRLAGVDGAGLEAEPVLLELTHVRPSPGERKVRTSVRVSDRRADGRRTSTSSAGAWSSISTHHEVERLADADRRQLRAHHLLDRRVEHGRIVERGVHELELVDAHPGTSAAANGGSFLHTGSCDTPCLRMSATASRTVSLGLT